MMTFCSIMQLSCHPHSRIAVLITGWTKIPHSFAIVNCFQIVHLLKLYGHIIDFFVDQSPYFLESLRQNEFELGQLYPDIYDDVINSVKSWGPDVEIDLVYRIAFPYDLSPWAPNHEVPLIVFFSTFGKFYNGDFILESSSAVREEADEQLIGEHLSRFPRVHFVTPSPWSARAVEPYNATGNLQARVTVITHGGEPCLPFSPQFLP